ncbi:MAG: hypothetical protein Q7J82_04675 [Coriobacteriia bacterium]|nr:hypothetical protein [Coriobacteriia bacterium]
MARMVRKQMYIEPRQDERLKQHALSLGKTEAEIMREALDRYFAGTDDAVRDEAWSKLMEMAARRRADVTITGKRTWTRDEIHERKPGRGW